MNSSLGKALDAFNKTKFAFVPITANNTGDKIDSTRDSTAEEEEEGEGEVVVASLSIRAILPMIVKMNIDRPIKDLSSSLLSVDKNSSIRYAIDLMIKQGIRNIGIRGNNDEDSYETSDHNNQNRKTKLLRVLNDRKILEFLISHIGRSIMHANGIDGLAEIDIINHLDILCIKEVKFDTTTSKAAAELLMDILNPCLILNGKEYGDYRLLTPWDIVMKTVK